MVSDKLLSVDHAANGILKVDSLNAAEKTEIVDPCAGLLLYSRVTALLVAMFIRSLCNLLMSALFVRNAWELQAHHVFAKDTIQSTYSKDTTRIRIYYYRSLAYRFDRAFLSHIKKISHSNVHSFNIKVSLKRPMQ